METNTIDQIVENLFRIFPLLSKNLTKSLRAKTNINPGTLYVMGVLNRHEMLSMSEIGCKLSMPKPHVTIHIDKLIADEIVERLFDPNDRRIINIRMTDKGKADFAAIKLEITKEMREKIKTLTEQKIMELLDTSTRLKSILSEIMIENTIHN